MIQYFYSTARGIAKLNKGEDKKIINIGKFKNEQEATIACKLHFEKACNFLEKMNKPLPSIYFI